MPRGGTHSPVLYCSNCSATLRYGRKWTAYVVVRATVVEVPVRIRSSSEVRLSPSDQLEPLVPNGWPSSRFRRAIWPREEMMDCMDAWMQVLYCTKYRIHTSSDARSRGTRDPPPFGRRRKRVQPTPGAALFLRGCCFCPACTEYDVPDTLLHSTTTTSTD